MMSMHHLGAVFAAAILFTACGSDGGEPLSPKLDELNDGIGSLQALADAHDVQIAAAASLGAVAIEETAYAANVEGVHEEMHHLMMDMGTCMHGGMPLDLTDLDEAMEAVESEMSDHAAAMAAAVDLPAALAEEARHQALVEDLVGTLHIHHQAMESHAMDFMCSDDSH